MPRIIIAGGTGLIGSRLASELEQAGHEIILLSRKPAERGAPTRTRVVVWDGRTASGWANVAEGSLAIVNLAGATIGRPPWTASYKALIRQSRVEAGRAVVDAVRQAQAKPRVVIQQSAIGYYGLHGDEIVTEDAPPGTDYLAAVCQDWEASTAAVEEVGVRRVVTRTALVLSSRGGVLPLIALPSRFFAGGPVGSGRQWWSWIHLADEVSAIRFLIENEAARGPFNLSAPNPVTNREFARILGRVLHRPSLVPAPSFALRLVLGQMAELLLLGGQRVLPQRLAELGYTFRFPQLEPALRDAFGRG